MVESLPRTPMNRDYSSDIGQNIAFTLSVMVCEWLKSYRIIESDLENPKISTYSEHVSEFYWLVMFFTREHLPALLGDAGFVAVTRSYDFF